MVVLALVAPHITAVQIRGVQKGAPLLPIPESLCRNI